MHVYTNKYDICMLASLSVIRKEFFEIVARFIQVPVSDGQWLYTGSHLVLRFIDLSISHDNVQSILLLPT
jgi:hypothetical protein